MNIECKRISWFWTSFIYNNIYIIIVFTCCPTFLKSGKYIKNVPLWYHIETHASAKFNNNYMLYLLVSHMARWLGSYFAVFMYMHICTLLLSCTLQKVYSLHFVTNLRMFVWIIRICEHVNEENKVQEICFCWYF